MLNSNMVLIRHSIDPLVEKAYIDSQKFHDGQVRKYTGAPYWTHTREVASILIRCGIEDPEMLVAAHGHDWFEDTDVTRDYVRDTYGEHVFQMIYDLTEPQRSGNRATRKRQEAQRLWYVLDPSQTIKCADLISNTEDIVAHDLGFAKVYLPEKRYVLDGLTRADPVVRAWAYRSLEKAEAALQVA